MSYDVPFWINYLTRGKPYLLGDPRLSREITVSPQRTGTIVRYNPNSNKRTFDEAFSAGNQIVRRSGSFSKTVVSDKSKESSRGGKMASGRIYEKLPTRYVKLGKNNIRKVVKSLTDDVVMEGPYCDHGVAQNGTKVIPVTVSETGFNTMGYFKICTSSDANDKLIAATNASASVGVQEITLIGGGFGPYAYYASSCPMHLFPLSKVISQGQGQYTFSPLYWKNDNSFANIPTPQGATAGGVHTVTSNTGGNRFFMQTIDDNGYDGFQLTKYVLHKWLDIRLLLRGCTNQTTWFDVRVIKIFKDYMNPQYNGTRTTDQAEEYKREWAKLAYKMSTNPLLRSKPINNKEKVSRWFSTVVKQRVYLEEQSSDMSSNLMREVNIKVRSNRLCNHMWRNIATDIPSGTYGYDVAPGTANYTSVFQADGTDFMLDQEPDWEARLYLLIRAHSPTDCSQLRKANLANTDYETPIGGLAAGTTDYNGTYTDTVDRKFTNQGGLDSETLPVQGTSDLYCPSYDLYIKQAYTSFGRI